MRHHNALAAGYRLHWYRIESVLGQGGFGITYLATDTNLDQPVAIKEFLPSDLAVRTQDSAVHPVSDARSDTFGWGLTRFLTEARTLAQFRHPNIVRVYSVFEANGTAYMVMEYERGTSLEDALKFRYLEGERSLVSLVHALMDGLELVHQAGFIHRDIKPDNIFMRSNDGVPVLLDFGSARQAVGVETKTLTSLVTPGYAPFEQYNATRENDRQGPWTDIYSLAATLYRGITGHGPIDAVARADALLSGNPDPLIPLARLEPTGVSAPLLAAVDNGLAFQPHDRPQTLAEWRSQLPARPTRPDFTAAALTMRAKGAVDQDDETVVRGDVPSRRDSTLPRPAPAAPQTAPSASPASSAPAAPPAAASPPPPAPPSAAAAPAPRSRAPVFTVVSLALVLIGAAGAWFLLDRRMPEPSSTTPPGVVSEAAPAPAATASAPAATPVVPETVAPAPAVSTATETTVPAPVAPEPEPEPAASARGTSGAPPTRSDEAATAGSPPETAAGPSDAAASLAQERARLEEERRALEAERARYALEQQRRDIEAARREAERQAREIAAERERLEHERRELEALRAAEEKAAAAPPEAPAAEAEPAAAEPQPPAVASAAPDTPTAGAPVPATPTPTPAAPATPVAPAAPAAPAPAAAAADDEAVRALLAAADEDLAALRLTSPPGNNAYERYRSVLEMDAGNVAAQAGLERIVSRYLGLAEDAAARGEFDRGEAMLERAARVDPDSTQVPAARRRLENRRRDAQARAAEQRRLEEEAEARLRAEQAAERERAAREAAARREAEAREVERRAAEARAREARRAAAEAAAQEQQRAEAEARRSVRLAVFPHDSIRTCFYTVGPRLHDAANRAAGASDKVDVVYSFYVRNADASVVGTGSRLWQGTAAKKSPNIPAVQAAARSMGADAVLMAWYDCHSVGGYDEHTYRADVYLVDVRTGKLYTSVMGVLDTNKAARSVLRSLFSARGL